MTTQPILTDWTRRLVLGVIAAAPACDPGPAEAPEIEPLRRRAEQGDVQAQSRLGQRYRRGEGVEKNEQTAAKWIRKAAEQGHAIAQSELALLYFDGRGVEKDAAAAAKWARKAAKQGKTFALDVLGLQDPAAR